jgi:hypothetical protein
MTHPLAAAFDRLIQCEELPDVATVFALGAELRREELGWLVERLEAHGVSAWSAQYLLQAAYPPRNPGAEEMVRTILADLSKENRWNVARRWLASCRDRCLAEILPRKSDANENVQPRWDEQGRELWYGEKRVKRYRNPARNQIDIIEAFHRAAWAKQIDDPFKNARKLNQTISDLNAGLAPGTIRFRGDGTGEGVIWDPA